MRILLSIISFLLAFSFSAVQAQSSKYFVSKIYPKGDFEVHMFNNYYSQVDDLGAVGRTSFFTSSTQFLYGVGKRINVVLNLKIRSVNQNLSDSAPYFEALKFKNDGFTSNNSGNTGYSRTGLTALGAGIKYQPFNNLANISFQHSLLIPIGSELEGNDETGWIDWSKPSFYNQFYYDSMFGDKFSLFTEFSIILENMSGAMFKKNSGFYQFSTPITLILNYYVTRTSTIYVLANAAPRWAHQVNEELLRISSSDPYNQFGIGYKLFLNSKLELEFLYTTFNSSVAGRNASTANFGIRYIGQ